MSASDSYGVIWNAPPHTIAKIRILEKYLVPFFSILGTSRPGQSLVYIDGFAGPGEYTDFPAGSPIAAWSAAQQARNIAERGWKAGQIHCVFIELDKDRFKNLQQRIDGFSRDPRITIQLICDTFENGISQLRTEGLPGLCDNSPLFVFIDPFGAKGVPFNVVQQILQNPTSEVLVNLDVDGIYRIFSAGEASNHEKILDTVFGTPTWRTRLVAGESMVLQAREVLALYIEQLRRIPNVKFIFPFEMRSKGDVPDYFLVFASQNPLGLEKMKEAMKQLDDSGNYQFIDSTVNQGSLFRGDIVDEHAPRMHSKFYGRTATHAEVREYVLNYTPYPTVGTLLKYLEDKKMIVVDGLPGRRKGSFQAEVIRSITFITPPATLPSDKGNGQLSFFQ